LKVEQVFTCCGRIETEAFRDLIVIGHALEAYGMKSQQFRA
jgi:hypothetical protein